MTSSLFAERRARLMALQQELLTRPNRPDARFDNGIVRRWTQPVVTADHVPLTWRYDFNESSNPRLLERLGVNGVFNPGAIIHDNKVCLVCRVEGYDRKSFFAIAESENGVDNFRFRDEPMVIPETNDPDANVYDMRVVKHEDGWIYGLFCTERKDLKAPAADLSSAVAQAGIVRSRDLSSWERLADLKTPSPQQRNVTLHPELVNGQYALYTRPQDDFISAGSGGGIGWALCPTMSPAVIANESVLDARQYHTIKEAKNGEGPSPLRTQAGWLHLAHGVRNTAAGLRYVLYMYLTDLQEPWRVTHRPGGYLLAPRAIERVGDVSNVLFCNGWVSRPDGSVYIYYASSDTRVHVATSTVDTLLDYVTNTPEDHGRSATSVQTRLQLIRRNGKGTAA